MITIYPSSRNKHAQYTLLWLDPAGDIHLFEYDDEQTALDDLDYIHGSGSAQLTYPNGATVE